MVLGERINEVKFDDPVIKESGQLTIGLQDPDPDKDEGVYWSLSLAHLRFYGDPVQVTSFTTRDASRLRMNEFHLLVLGSILSDWGSLCTSDFTDAAEFFVALDDSIRTAVDLRAASEDSLLPTIGSSHLEWEAGWIRILGKTCKGFLSLKNTERSIASNIIALGHRRWHSLLSNDTDRPPSMLGLCHPWIQYFLRVPVRRGIDERITLVRFIAKTLELRHEQCIIGVRPQGKYVTAVPHIEKNADGRNGSAYSINWVEMGMGAFESIMCDCHQRGYSCHSTDRGHVSHCACIRNGATCRDKCHAEDMGSKPCRCQEGHAGFPMSEESINDLGCDNFINGEAVRYINAPLFLKLSTGLAHKLRSSVLDKPKIQKGQRRQMQLPNGTARKIHVS